MLKNIAELKKEAEEKIHQIFSKAPKENKDKQDNNNFEVNK